MNQIKNYEAKIHSKDIEDEQQEKEKVREGTVIKKKQQKENFVRCKESCVCKEKICKAAGLKECSVCGDVMKSQCSKARCTVEGIKPMMKLSWYDTDKKLNRSKAVSKGKRKGTKQIQAEDDTATDINVDSDYSYEAESEEEGENIDYDSCDEEQASTSSVKPTNEYGDPLDYDHVKAGMWVVVLYEEERFIGKVQ